MPAFLAPRKDFRFVLVGARPRGSKRGFTNFGEKVSSRGRHDPSRTSCDAPFCCYLQGCTVRELLYQACIGPLQTLPESVLSGTAFTDLDLDEYQLGGRVSWSLPENLNEAGRLSRALPQSRIQIRNFESA